VSGACLARVWRIFGLAVVCFRGARKLVYLMSGSCLACVWRVSSACQLRVSCVSGACLARVWLVSGPWLVRVCALCVWRVSGACLERVWRVAPARRACGTYMMRRERDVCVSGTCLGRVLLVSGASLV
jgi:hypothetical protein